MKTTEFFEAVRREAALGSTRAAEEVTVATLQTLGEHVSEGQEADLAADLPDELAEALVGDDPRPPESFALPEFLARVGERAGIDESAALERSRAVLSVLADVVGEPEMRDTRDQLPAEFDLVFEAGEPLDAAAFLDRVERTAGLESETAARDATRVVLRTLGERIDRGLAENVAAYLPEEFADAVAERSTHEPEGLDKEEFIERVADREGVDPAAARAHVEAVFDCVARVAGETQVRRLHAQLPDEFAALFDASERSGRDDA